MRKISNFIAISVFTVTIFGASTQLKAQQISEKEAPQVKTPEPRIGINVGDMAPDISYNNPDGKPISLYSLRGKMVLIDFWASWCRPCRMENPNVVMAYSKFKDKKYKTANGFTVLGVSLDKDKDSWIGAIKQDNLTWNQISDLAYWNSAPARLYQVQGIPTNFLIDGKGKIVATNLRGEALDAELSKHLLAK